MEQAHHRVVFIKAKDTSNVGTPYSVLPKLIPRIGVLWNPGYY
jgi:hypothetical protein